MRPPYPTAFADRRHWRAAREGRSLGIAPRHHDSVGICGFHQIRTDVTAQCEREWIFGGDYQGPAFAATDVDERRARDVSELVERAADKGGLRAHIRLQLPDKACIALQRCCVDTPLVSVPYWAQAAHEYTARSTGTRMRPASFAYNSRCRRPISSPNRSALHIALKRCRHFQPLCGAPGYLPWRPHTFAFLEDRESTRR
jgi:hypothetical protein